MRTGSLFFGLIIFLSISSAIAAPTETELEVRPYHDFESLVDSLCPLAITNCPANANFQMISENALERIRYNPVKDPLNLDEVVAIHLYTRGLYNHVNQGLRAHNHSMDTYVKVMTTGLQKLPDYRGLVTRYDDMPWDILDGWQAGTTITYDSFMSASRRKNLCDTKHTLGNYCLTAHEVILISSVHGKSIDKYSFLPAEGEVLFLPSTRFRVQHRSVRADGHIEIHLKELDIMK